MPGDDGTLLAKNRAFSGWTVLARAAGGRLLKSNAWPWQWLAFTLKENRFAEAGAFFRPLAGAGVLLV